jgi:hypothetical protein
MPGALREGPPVSATDVVPAEPVLNEGFDLLEWAKKPMVDFAPERSLGVQELRFGAGNLPRPRYLKAKLIGEQDAAWSMTCTSNVNLAGLKMGRLPSELLAKNPSFLMANSDHLKLFGLLLRCVSSVAHVGDAEMLAAYRRRPSSRLLSIAKKFVTTVPASEVTSVREGIIQDLSPEEFEQRLGEKFFTGEKVALPLAVDGMPSYPNSCKFKYKTDATIAIALSEIVETGPYHTTTAVVSYDHQNRLIGLQTTTDHLGVREIVNDRIGRDVLGNTRFWGSEITKEQKLVSRTVFVLGSKQEVATTLATLGVTSNRLRPNALYHGGDPKLLLKLVQLVVNGMLTTVGLDCSVVEDDDSLESISRRDSNFFKVKSFGNLGNARSNHDFVTSGIAKLPII